VTGVAIVRSLRLRKVQAFSDDTSFAALKTLIVVCNQLLLDCTCSSEGSNEHGDLTKSHGFLKQMFYSKLAITIITSQIHKLANSQLRLMTRLFFQSFSLICLFNNSQIEPLCDIFCHQPTYPDTTFTS